MERHDVLAMMTALKLAGMQGVQARSMPIYRYRRADARRPRRVSNRCF